MTTTAGPPLSTMEALGEEQAQERQLQQQLDQTRQQDRQEFFRTYDLMTGVRIAATLGGFFGMMVLLVLYKSRCRGRRDAIKEVRLAAAKAVVEEEDQQEAVAAAMYMQTVVTGRVPRRSLGALSAPVGPLGPRGSLAFVGGPGAAGAAGAAAALPPGGLQPDPSAFPLPVRFSSLGGCSLLDATVAISSVRRASMLPNTPTRHLHQRLHQHQQRHVQQRRESKQLQLQRLEQLLPRVGPDGAEGAAGDGVQPCLGPGPGLEATSPARSDPGPAQTTASTAAASRAKDAVGHTKRTRARSASVHAGSSAAYAPRGAPGPGPRRPRHARGPGAAGVAVVHPLRKGSVASVSASASPFLGRRPLGHGPFVLRTPLGVIDSSPEGMASPVGSLTTPSDHGVFASVLAARCKSIPAAAAAVAAPALAAQDGHDSSDNNSLSCQVLPYGAACESFELAELAYGEAAAPLARISTLEAASIKDGDGIDSGSDSVFGVLATHHGQAADTAADTGVDTGLDTDQDADGQLSTDSNGSSSSTPHQTAGAGHERRLYVLPAGVAPKSGASVVTLHEEPDPDRHGQPMKHGRLRPRLARASKVVVASLDSAASDDCITTTPEQSVRSREGQEQQQQQQQQQRERGQAMASPP